MRDGVGISAEHGIRTDRPQLRNPTGLALCHRRAAEWFVTSCTRSAPERGVAREASAAPRAISTGALIPAGNGAF